MPFQITLFSKEIKISEIADLLKKSIDGKNPFGENINYDSDFENLKNEISKLGNLNYALIEKNALTILEKKSKDLRVFSFLSFIYLRNEVWEKYADVFESIVYLSECNFDKLYPDRQRAKELSIKWLSEERYISLASSIRPSGNDYQHIVRLTKALLRLKLILETKIPNTACYLSDLFRIAQEWERTSVVKNAINQEIPVSSGCSDNSTQFALISQPDSVNEVQFETASQARGAIRNAAFALIREEPQKPTGYRVMRCTKWDLLDRAPYSESGKTKLSGPSVQQREMFLNLIDQKNWKTLFERAETTFVSGANHFWLDLQRFSITSCKELGADYDFLRLCLVHELYGLLKRVPELVSLSFSDGTPFCDDKTNKWIQTEILGAFTINNNKSDTLTDCKLKNVDGYSKELQEIESLADSENFESAIDLIQEKLNSSTCQRENFKFNLLLGTVFIKAKQPLLAISTFEMLEHSIDEYKIYKWEPELSVEIWTMLLQSYQLYIMMKPHCNQSGIQEKQNCVLQKICNIDPKKALMLSRKDLMKGG